MHLTQKECYDKTKAVQFVKNCITKGDSFLKGAKDNQVYPQRSQVTNKGLSPGCYVRKNTGYIYYNRDLVGSPRDWDRNICKGNFCL